MRVMLTDATRMPMKMRATPSMIHSIMMILLFSRDMSPKPSTTELVGNRWAIPHSSGRADPTYSRIGFNMVPPF